MQRLKQRAEDHAAESVQARTRSQSRALHHHTSQFHSNDGLACTAEIAYPYLRFTLKSFLWLLCAGWEAVYQHVCPPLSSATSLMRGSLFTDWWLPGGDTAIGGTAAGVQNQHGNPSMLPLHRGQTTFQ